ncbi:MAG: pyridoxamine 5'-phosphate oxidase family protein [Nitrososphaerales archaeon]
MPQSNLTWNTVKKELRKRSYGIISTISKDGRPHSTGILYATSNVDQFCLYVLTDKSSAKARNITHNPNISFVVPIPRRLLRFIPPGSVQFQGTAEIVPLSEDVRKAFSRSIALRQTLGSASTDDSCFVKIIPDTVVFTYGLGVSLMQLVRNPDSAVGKVRI